MIDNAIINEIRSKTDIVTIISSYLPLTKKGKNYFGVCPFHDDHSPSMSVSADKQIYTCFSCGASGNVFTFISDYEHISFIEAVKLLGQRVGYNFSSKEKKESCNDNYAIYDKAVKFYQNNLYTLNGKNAISYLKSRHLDEEVISKFKIGLSLSSSSLTSYLLGVKYDLKNLVKLGLTSEAASDVFINRIMFPLFDLNGNVVGFSGRIYNTKDSSKYINTKETEIFKKGNILYNYHNAREHLKKSDSVIVMEGFMDVIRASTIGINNCVATMGTALTMQNALTLKKMAKNIILCFDGDSAGEEATSSAIEVLEKIDVKPKIVRLEENLDPDEYILSKGESSFKAKITSAISTLEFKMSILKQKRNLSDIDDISKYLNASLSELIKEEDELIVELTLKKLSSEYNISLEVLQKRYQKLKINKPIKEEVKSIIKEKKYGKYQKAERYLLYYMLKETWVLEYVRTSLSYFPTDILRYLANELFTFYNKYGILSNADFITYLSDKDEIYKVYKEIISMPLKEKCTKSEIEDYIYLINEYPKKSRINTLERELREEPDPVKKADILSKIMEIKGVKA